MKTAKKSIAVKTAPKGKTAPKATDTNLGPNAQYPYGIKIADAKGNVSWERFKSATERDTRNSTVKGKRVDFAVDVKTAPAATPTAPVKGKGKGKTATAPAAPVKSKGKTAPAATPTAPTPRHTKKGDALELLKKGVSLESLMEKFGWQRHTVRGFISVLGKTHKIESTSVEGVRTYKIA